jgi:hypothetical protein
MTLKKSARKAVELFSTLYGFLTNWPIKIMVAQRMPMRYNREKAMQLQVAGKTAKKSAAQIEVGRKEACSVL